MLTRGALGLLTTALFLLVAGLPTGNSHLITLALVPLVFLLLASAGTRRATVRTRLVVPERPARVGDRLTLVVEYEARGGTGILELHQPIPGIFTLESGNNLHTYPKRAGTDRGRFTFEVRCTRRGHHVFPPADWTLAPTGGLGLAASGQSGQEMAVDVRPALTSLRRTVRLRTRATRFLPDQDDAKMGVQTTEFRDIRGYVRGDPPKTVNWKATARVASRNLLPPAPDDPTRTPRRHVVPLVNEYEHEGRKAVWVYLDCAPYMRVGTSADNLFEVAVDAAHKTVQHFADRGYRVGLTLFDRPEPLHLHPDSGKRQVQRVQQVLADAEPTETLGGLPRAVEGSRRHLLMGRTLVFVITRAERAEGTIEAGLRRLRRLTATRNRRPPVIVVSPDALGLLPDLHAGTAGARLIERHRHAERIEALGRLGVTVLHWDPKTTRYEAVLHRSVGD